MAAGWYTADVRHLWAAFVLCAAAGPVLAGVTVEPPPGWEDVTASRRDRNLLASLKGPETSSFVLTRIDPLSLENRGVVRSLLLDVLSEIEARAKLGLRPATNLVTTTFSNDLTAHYIRADIKDRPRMILAVAEFQGTYMLATLISSVPDTLLGSLMGSLKSGPSTSQQASAAGSVETLDGQLSFLLPAGVSPRPLTPREKKMGFVAAFTGLGSELMVMKLVDEGTPMTQQPEIVRGTALSVEGALPATLSPTRKTATSAGPELVFASIKVKDASGAESQFAAGYMPWGYWGYSALAKGPAALELQGALFSRLSLGSSAVPKLVAATPKVPLSQPTGRKMSVPLAAGAALLVVLLVWRIRAK